MKRAIVVLTILVLLVTSVSCMPTKTGPSQKDLDQDAVISDLKTTVGTKVSKETFDGLKSTVDTVKSDVETLKGKSSTDSYTREQVDAAIKNAINNLKNDQTWITAKTSITTPVNPSTPNNPIPNIGQNTWQYGTYQLFNVSGGQANSYIFFNGTSATGASTNMWQLIVTNTSAGPLYIAPQVLFTTSQSSPKITWDTTIDTGTLIKGIKIAPNGWSNGLTLNISPALSDPAVGVQTNTLTIMPNSGGTSGGGIFVGAGQSQSWYITVAVATLSGNSGPWTLNVTPIGWWSQ